MLLTVFVSSTLLLFFMMFGLGLKWIFHTKSGFPVHSCGIKEGGTENNEVCSTCGLNNLIDCAEVKVSRQNVVTGS